VRLPRTMRHRSTSTSGFCRSIAKTPRLAFQQMRGLKVAQSLMPGVDWILPWAAEERDAVRRARHHDISASEWVMAAILATMKRIPLYRDLQNQHQCEDSRRSRTAF